MEKSSMSLVAILLATLMLLSTAIHSTCAQNTHLPQPPPKAEIYFKEQGHEDIILKSGEETKIVIFFDNKAEADISNVASTIQYITLAAANLDPFHISIAESVSWGIYKHESESPRVNGIITSEIDHNARYSPHSKDQIIDLYTWRFGEPSDTLDQYTNNIQFIDDLKVLRPGEFLKLEIAIESKDEGKESKICFFAKASEHLPEKPIVTDINEIPQENRMNLYFDDRNELWWPLYDSFNPYDQDINSGYVFEYESWKKRPLKTAYTALSLSISTESSTIFDLAEFRFESLIILSVAILMIGILVGALLRRPPIIERRTRAPPHEVGKFTMPSPSHDNEDSSLVIDYSSSSYSGTYTRRLLLVADGVGGRSAGEIASSTCSRIVTEILSPSMTETKRIDFSNVLRKAIVAANKKLFTLAKKDGRLQGMATTIVSTLVIGKQLYVANVGNSRAYLIRGKTIARLTKDHTVVQELIDKGKITPQQAISHPKRNAITRAVGNKRTVRVDVRIYGVQKGDLLLLCSDGLSDFIRDQEILSSVLQASNNYTETCKRLANLAMQRGSKDDITIILSPLPTNTSAIS